MFNNEKIMAAARKLGLEIEINTDNPGLFFQDDNKEILASYNFDDLNMDFSGKINSNINLTEKVVIRKNLQFKDVTEFKKQWVYNRPYSDVESKSMGELNYFNKISPDGSMSVSNKTDKAA